MKSRRKENLQCSISRFDLFKKPSRPQGSWVLGKTNVVHLHVFGYLSFMLYFLRKCAHFQNRCAIFSFGEGGGVGAKNTPPHGDKCLGGCAQWDELGRGMLLIIILLIFFRIISLLVIAYVVFVFTYTFSISSLLYITINYVGIKCQQDRLEMEIF